MARIAIGGFHHETNCFVDSRTDCAYFASHRDRPPLCYGAVIMCRRFPRLRFQYQPA